MNSLLTIFWASLLCLIVSILIITFPETYLRTSIKKGATKKQIHSIIVYSIICCSSIILYKANCFSAIEIETKTALMIIPVIACVLFSAFLYYPLTRFLVQKNTQDQDTMDKLLKCIFKCSFSDKDRCSSALSDLNNFIDDNEEFVKQYSLSIYLSEYIAQAQFSINSKPAESLIRCVLEKCNLVKNDIDNFSPAPFTNIGLILSFVFSTVLTVLLSILTITT